MRGAYPIRNEPGQLPKRSAKSYAMWLLSRREYTAKELYARLTSRGYPADQAADAVGVMQEHKFQSDERFAESKARLTSRKLGNQRVVVALTDAGISKELATAQVATLEPEEDRAIAAVSKFEGKQLDDAGRTKVWQYLMRRGFSSSAIKTALKHLKASTAELADEY